MGRSFASIAVASSGFFSSGRGTDGATGVLVKRSTAIVKPLPGIHYVSVIRLSNPPVALAITAAAVLNWVSALYRWLLLALLNSLLLLAGLLREPPCRNRNSHLMLGLPLQTTYFGGNCFSTLQHVLMLGGRLSHELQILLCTPLLRSPRAVGTALLPSIHPPNPRAETDPEEYY